MSENGQDPFDRVGMIVFIGTMVITVLFMVYVSFFEKGISYDTIREKGSNVQLAFDPATVSNPWVSSAKLIEHGAKKYKAMCATCHGAKGAGDGPSAGGMVPVPRNLVKGDWKFGGDTVGLYKLLVEGSPGTPMVGYGSMLSPGDLWALVHFIHSITQNKKETPAAELEAFAKSQ